MKRTDFLKNLGIGIVTIPLVPSILSKEEVVKIPEEPVEPPKPIAKNDFFTLSSDSFHITDWDWVKQSKPKSKRKRLSGKKKHGKRKRR